MKEIEQCSFQFFKHILHILRHKTINRTRYKEFIRKSVNKKLLLETFCMRMQIIKQTRFMNPVHLHHMANEKCGMREFGSQSN